MAPINNQLQTRTISKYLNNFHLFSSFFKSKSLGKFTYFRFRIKTTYVRLNYNKWLKHLHEWTLNCWKWVDFGRFILSSNDVRRFVFNSGIFQCSMEYSIFSSYYIHIQMILSHHLLPIHRQELAVFNHSWLYRIIHDYIASFTMKSANNNRNCRMNNHHRQYSVVCYTNFHWYIIENNSFMPWKWMKIAIQLCKFIREKKTSGLCTKKWI